MSIEEALSCDLCEVQFERGDIIESADQNLCEPCASKSQMLDLAAAIMIRKSCNTCPSCDVYLTDGEDHEKECAFYSIEARVGLTRDQAEYNEIVPKLCIHVLGRDVFNK